MTQSPGKILLEMKGIGKTFPGVKALEGVNLTVREGQVHALLGENGAGKSTLIKILSGAYSRDEGEIFFEGQPVDIKSPQDAQALGISTIYQEFNLASHLTIAENIFLGHLPRKGMLVDWNTLAGNPEQSGRQPVGRYADLRAVRRRTAACRDRQGAEQEDAHPDHG